MHNKYLARKKGERIVQYTEHTKLCADFSPFHSTHPPSTHQCTCCIWLDPLSQPVSGMAPVYYTTRLNWRDLMCACVTVWGFLDAIQSLQHLPPVTGALWVHWSPYFQIFIRLCFRWWKWSFPLSLCLEALMLFSPWAKSADGLRNRQPRISLLGV